MIIAFPLVAALGASSLAPLAPGPSQDLPPAAADSSERPAPGAALTSVDDWAGLWERDARLDFPQTGGAHALADLEGRRSSEDRRIVALMAVGCSRARGGASVLQVAAAEGPIELRRAALFALGEYGSVEAEELVRLSDTLEPELVSPLLVGLARSGNRVAREELAAVAERDEGEPGELARALVASIDRLEEMEERPVVRELLELRWKAAVEYGLVDGRSWRTWLNEELAQEPAFLDALVYRGAARIKRPGVADLYLEAVLNGTGEQRLRGAVANIPAELSRLVVGGVWTPTEGSEWNALLLEIERRGLEAQALDLLRTLRLVPGIGTYAAILLVRGGSPDGLPLVELDLHSPDPARRALVCRSLGDSKVRRYVLTLEPLLEDDDPIVRANALVSQVRLNHVPAIEALAEALKEPEDESFPALVQALCDAVYDPLVVPHVLKLHDRTEGDLRLWTSIALTRAGRIGSPRWEALDALADGQVAPRIAQEIVQALGKGADQEELEVMRAQFPSPQNFELNVELGLALLKNRDAGMLSLLRQALWSGPWHRSLLAAALLIDLDGLEALRVELVRPPSDSTLAGQRRIGYALGHWGGLEEVERLARRSRANDPALQGALLGALAARTH